MARTAPRYTAPLVYLLSCVAMSCASESDGDTSGAPFSTTAAETSATESRGEAQTSTGQTTGGPASESGSGTLDPSATTEEATSEDSSGGDTEVTECAPAPSPAPRWLRAQLDTVVAALTGAAPLPGDGTVLAERSTASNRAAAAAYVHSTFESLGLQTQRHDYSATGSNVVARLAATGASAGTLVVGAHYDSVPGSPGANDNATGVGLLVTLARYLSGLQCRSYDLVFVAFDEEEIGLLGSDAFAQLLVDQGVDVVAVHTIDQMGWDQDGDRAVELERADEGLFEFYETAAADLGIPLTPTQTGFTDHVSFRTYGFAAIGLTEEFVSGDTTPHYHLNSDTYATVDLDFLTSTATLMNAAFGSFVDGS